jgi:hypothetical protein
LPFDFLLNLRVQLANYGNVLEQQRQDSIAKDNSLRMQQQRNDGVKELMKLREKKQLLSTQFLQESEDFEIYGNVLPSSGRKTDCMLPCNLILAM